MEQALAIHRDIFLMPLRYKTETKLQGSVLAVITYVRANYFETKQNSPSLLYI